MPNSKRSGNTTSRTSSSDAHRIRPAQLVHPPGARDFEERAGLGLPPNGYSSHDPFTRECHIFDQILTPTYEKPRHSQALGSKGKSRKPKRDIQRSCQKLG